MKRILVAPLNWGLGHAARCIPIIEALSHHGFEPVIASDGAALELLKKEFPQFKSLELPSYNISYPKNGRFLKWKLLLDSSKVLRSIKLERQKVDSIIKTEEITGIISDNRFGVYSTLLPSVFITHQLNVLSGNTSWMSSKINQSLIKKFTQCWVPDHDSELNLSGKLGHLPSFEIPVKYLGVISRFERIHSKKIYDLLVLLSGPEPQRSLLEALLLDKLSTYQGQVLFVKGIIEKEQTLATKNNLTMVNFMQRQELQNVINTSELILARSGYSTILDLAKMEKKAFFIPTPGQYEQEYLARRLDQKDLAPFCIQKEFTVDALKVVSDYKGFKGFDSSSNLNDLFGLFKGE
jgi:uncharacterized protein (TIGR00661 family)